MQQQYAGQREVVIERPVHIERIVSARPSYAPQPGPPRKVHAPANASITSPEVLAQRFSNLGHPQVSQGFPYHDPAFGCHFRQHEANKDPLNHALQQADVDVAPPLLQLRWRACQEQVAMEQRRKWESMFDEMKPPRAFRPMVHPTHQTATTCVTGDQDYDGLGWFLYDG